MNSLIPYYRKCIPLALGFGTVAGLLTGQWSTGVIVAMWTIGFSLWAPHSGRYVIDRAGNAREDERSRSIRARAAEIGFIVVLGGLSLLWFVIRVRGGNSVPVSWPLLIALAGLGTQIAVDYFLSRRPLVGG